MYICHSTNRGNPIVGVQRSEPQPPYPGPNFSSLPPPTFFHYFFCRVPPQKILIQSPTGSEKFCCRQAITNKFHVHGGAITVPDMNQVREKLYGGIILYMHPTNERRRYIVTSSLIGWVHTQNNPCIWTAEHELTHRTLGDTTVISKYIF